MPGGLGEEGETVYSYYLFLCGNVWEYISDVWLNY